MGDSIENNREITLNIWEAVINGGADIHRDLSDSILQALIARINVTPYPEKSEDLREKILELLRLCLRFRDSLPSSVGELSVAMAKCLGDPSSTIKNVTE